MFCWGRPRDSDLVVSGHGPPRGGPWYGLLRQCQCATECCGGLAVSFREDVAVHPQGYRSVGMAQAPRDRPHVVATGDQLGSGEVTKRVEMRIHAGSFGDAWHELRHDVRPDRLGTHRRPREDEGVRWDLEVKVSCQFVDLGSVPPQDLESDLVDSDAPDLVGLRGLLSPSTTFCLVDTPSDGQDTSLPVHIAPAQCAQFASTCPGDAPMKSNAASIGSIFSASAMSAWTCATSGALICSA